MWDTNFTSSKLLHDKKIFIKIFFPIFYLVGLVGLLLPISYPLFVKLIPYSLLLSFVGLAFFYPYKILKRELIIFASIYFLGFAVEAIGVNTGLIFGSYSYGLGLGFKVFETPLIIGLNWLFLVYVTSTILEPFKLPALVKAVLASTLMVIYDVVLEQVAPKMDMWSWSDSIVPIKNYVAWFSIALLFHLLLKIFKVRSENSFSLLIFLCQFLFFIALFLFLR